MAEELACELVLSSGQAERVAFNSVGFVLEAAQTLDYLERGEIDLPKAEAILDSVRTVIDGTLDADPDGPEPHRLAEGLQEKVLRRAPGQTVSNLKRACSKAVIQIDPEAAERRHKVKRERRHIRLVPMDDSMCLLEVYLPADQALRAYAVLTALAEAARSEGDGRSVDQRRVDALVDALMNVLALFDATDIRHRCAHPEHDHEGPTTSEPPAAEDGCEDAAAGTAAESDRPAGTSPASSATSSTSAGAEQAERAERAEQAEDTEQARRPSRQRRASRQSRPRTPNRPGELRRPGLAGGAQRLRMASWGGARTPARPLGTVRPLGRGWLMGGRRSRSRVGPVRSSVRLSVSVLAALG